jgi:hypothetical protein
MRRRIKHKASFEARLAAESVADLSGVAASETRVTMEMSLETNDPLARFGLDAIDLRWTLKDIASKRKWIINKAHVAKLIDLALSRCVRTLPI